MKRFTLIIIALAMAQGAWAGDWVDYPTCPDDGKAYQYAFTDDGIPFCREIKPFWSFPDGTTWTEGQPSPRVKRDELMPSCFKDWNMPTTLEYRAETHELNPSIPENILPANDIADILQRCLEFVEDNTEDSIGSYTALAIYQPMDRESLQRRSIQEAQEHLKKLERETALRHDIERALKALKGE